MSSIRRFHCRQLGKQQTVSVCTDSTYLDEELCKLQQLGKHLIHLLFRTVLQHALHHTTAERVSGHLKALQQFMVSMVRLQPPQIPASMIRSCGQATPQCRLHQWYAFMVLQGSLNFCTVVWLGSQATSNPMPVLGNTASHLQ